MRKFGLIGYPLSHSFSVQYFTEKFKAESIADCQYNGYPIEQISELSQLLFHHPELIGLNVTIPYKQKVIPYLHELHSSAEAVGAVNTIKIIASENGPKLIGFNTDVEGFSKALKPFLKNNHQRALILGTGGASKAVAFVLKNLGIDCAFVTRNPSNVYVQKNALCFTYLELNHHHMAAFQLIVNCTPVGMYPKIEDFPALPYESIGAEHLLFDLVYNPEESEFLKKGKERGALIQNGLTMLYLQAEAAWKIWNS